MIKRFFTWGYTKFVLLPYLRSQPVCWLSVLNEDDPEIDQAMHEKEVLQKYDRRTDH